MLMSRLGGLLLDRKLSQLLSVPSSPRTRPRQTLMAQDVRLGSEPAEKDGGRSRGFGSLWEYEVRLCT